MVINSIFTSNFSSHNLSLTTLPIQDPSRVFLLKPPVLQGDVYFPEFSAPSQLCRYRDCQHIIEDGCGVQSAVKAGEIHEFRYKTYVRLMGEIGVV